MRNPGVFYIERITTRAILELKSWMPARTPPSLPAPAAPADCRLLSWSPGEWLLISDTLDARSLRQHAHHIHHQGIATVSGSPGLAAIRFEGPAARDVLKDGCGLDFHPASFQTGTCTRTRLAGLPVIIDYRDAGPRFELYVGRSYVPYLNSWLLDAALGK
jgi:sarcosine oxidase, subunit gamma